MTSPPSHVGLDAALLLGPGLDGGAARWGGALGLWWMAHAPRIGVRAGVRYQVASDPLQLTWAAVALGGTTRLTEWDSALSLAVSAEALVQRASATARRDGAAESESLVRWGGRLGSRIGLDLGGPVQPWLGWEMTLLRPAFEVRLGDARIGAEAPLAFGVALGVTILPLGG